jgi:predicted transposase/invertase (TIGR01784 family)
MKEQKFFTPTNDFVFKMIFGDEHNIDILTDFLQAILDLPPEEYEHIQLADPHAKREREKDKLGILDVKVRTKTGQLIDIEIQVSDTPFMRKRIIFYLSKLITEQIGKGMDYENIKRVISIVITDYVLAPATNVCHDQFFLYSELTKTKFSDIVEIDTLELPKIPADRDPPSLNGAKVPLRHNEKLRQWTKFLAGKNREDFMALAQTSPTMNKAVGVLMELNASQRRRMLAESREKARRDERARINYAVKGAYTSGKEDGLREGADRAYKELGVPITDITAKTGLSTEEIERL